MAGESELWNLFTGLFHECKQNPAFRRFQWVFCLEPGFVGLQDYRISYQFAFIEVIRVLSEFLGFPNIASAVNYCK